MTSYFSVVGITPMACANSIAWYVKDAKLPQITDVYFITSWDSSGADSDKARNHVDSVVALTQKNLERLAPERIGSITFHRDDIIWMPEEDLVSGVRCITNGVFERTKEAEDLVIDATAGRKTMSCSAILAGYLLQNSFNRKVAYSYHWLKNYRPEILGKTAFELSQDDAETIVTNVDALNKEISLIEEKCEKLARE